MPDLWPSYFKKTKGCLVTDLDNKKYYDLSTMSVGTNSLGYSNSKVDSAVKKVINNGNISTLNCPEGISCKKTCKITYVGKKSKICKNWR